MSRTYGFYDREAVWEAAQEMKLAASNVGFLAQNNCPLSREDFESEASMLRELENKIKVYREAVRAQGYYKDAQS